MRESQVEKKVTTYAAVNGWLSIKLNGTGSRGKPDRLFLKDGQAVFVEFKAPGRKREPIQINFAENLQKQGFKTFVIDQVSIGKKLVDRGFTV